MLTKIFRVLDLSQKHELLYAEALKLGEQPASVLAQKVHLNRSDAYKHLKTLCEMGIFRGRKRNGIKHFTACSPDKLIGLIKDREASIHEARIQLDNIMPALMSAEDIVFYKERKGAMDLLERSLKCREKFIRFYGSSLNVANVTSRSHDEKHYIATRVREGIRLRQLIPRDHYGKRLSLNDKEELRETKFLISSAVPDSTLLMYDDELIILINKDPFLGFLVKNHEIVKLFKGWFDALWGGSE
ncbi:MAG: hypothetical protein ABII07_02505 [Patescibacteria group bacterium]|nr:hypothetical protein [Patescibacteria group bacterium]